MLTPQELHIRAAFFSAIRSFFKKNDFLEVDTPIRQPVIIPESNILPISAEGRYLQTSPELCMKRLLATGCEKIFQICPCFRKEESGRHHLEEFTMLEWYRSGATYLELMEDCEELLVYVLRQLAFQFPEEKVFPLKNLVSSGEDLNSRRPWERLSVKEAFLRYSPLALDVVMQDDIFDEILVEYIEPQLGLEAPLFLYDYPVELASLARRKGDDDSLAERFEVYYQGLELANGFSELTEREEQCTRFKDEIKKIEKESRKTSSMPQRFLESLDHLDKAAGIALGVDRLFMLIMGKETVGDVVTFSPADL